MDNSKEVEQRIKKAFITKTPKDKEFTRIGNSNDGGYVIVNDFSYNDYLISMGVANDVSFEEELCLTFSGMDLYDYSINFLPKPVKNSRFFQEKISDNSHHIFDRVPKDKDLILKIDIESGEWDFFDSLSSDQINRFRQIIIEIHWAIKTQHINYPTLPIWIIEKINKTHQVVAVHPNNYGGTVIVGETFVPQVMELTFLRKSDYTFTNEQNSANHLFKANNPYSLEIQNYL